MKTHGACKSKGPSNANKNEIENTGHATPVHKKSINSNIKAEGNDGKDNEQATSANKTKSPNISTSKPREMEAESHEKGKTNKREIGVFEWSKGDIYLGLLKEPSDEDDEIIIKSLLAR